MHSSRLNTKLQPDQLDARPRTLQFEAIGTAWHIYLETPLTYAAYQNLSLCIHSRIAIYDQHYSRFRADSFVTVMSKAPGIYQLPDDAQPLLDIYEKMYQITDGRMTPLVGALLEDAGYDANYSLQPKPLRPTPSWGESLSYNFPTIMTKNHALLDFGAAGKGYLVDIVAAIIQDAGIDSFSINAGGDIVNYNAPPELAVIGLEHPSNDDEIVGLAKVTTGSLCGSAVNRRRWGAYHHIMNPITEQPTTSMLATWVVADTGLLADALATALFFVEARALTKHFNFQYAAIGFDMSLTSSDGFPANFFLEQRRPY